MSLIWQNQMQRHCDFRVQGFKGRDETEMSWGDLILVFTRIKRSIKKFKFTIGNVSHLICRHRVTVYPILWKWVHTHRTHTQTHQSLRAGVFLEKKENRVSNRALAGMEEQHKSAYNGKHTPPLFHHSCKII